MKFDVVSAENDYVTDSSMSYRRLATKYEVNYSTIASYAKKNDWLRKREEYQSKLVQETIGKALKNNSSTGADKLTKLADATDNAIDVVAGVLESYKNGSESFTTKTLKDVVSTLRELISAQRDVNDILTIKEQHAIEFAKEKLEIDKRKSNIDNDNDNETGIALLPRIIEEVDESFVVREGETNA